MILLIRIERWVKRNRKEVKYGIRIEFKVDWKCMNEQYYVVYGREKW
jgi:hypothetical protein